MMLLILTPGNRSVLGSITMASCLLVAIISCGSSSSVDSTHGGAGGDDGGSGGACVSVSGAGDEPWFDLTVVGTQFDADEGERMRIVVATQTGNRVGIADLPIVGGAFTLSMPDVLNAGWYIGITLYVDRNDNDTCETDEHVWDWTTRSVIGDMRFDVTPDELCDSTLMACRPLQPTLQACSVGTGDTNLMERLPCIP